LWEEFGMDRYRMGRREGEEIDKGEDKGGRIRQQTREQYAVDRV